MANEKPEDVLSANAGAPAAMIPDLKKKEKERKKAGAAWSGARGAAGEFSGATGGTVARAAASAAAEAGMVGAEGAESGGLWAAISRVLAGLTSTLLGRLAVGAAALLMVAAAGLLGYGLYKGNGSAAVGTPDLGGISDSLRVREGGSDRLGVASKGEIRFDPQAAAKPAAPTPPPEPPKADDKAVPDKTADADKPVPSGQLAHNLSAAQLSSSLGGNFGGKNIFSGNSSAPKFGSGIGLPPFAGSKGNLSAMTASRLHATPSSQSIHKGSASRALGQLKDVSAFSTQGADQMTATPEGGSQSATDAFEQQATAGGGLTTPGAPGGDSVVPPGSGAPGDPGLPTAPSDPTGGGTDPGLQGALAQISQLANQAMSDMQTGTMEMVLGGILIAIGCNLPAPFGIALIVAGSALVLMGIMEIMKAKQEEQQAMSMGQTLASQIGDMQQGAAINYCTQNAVNNGVDTSKCIPPEPVTDANQEAAQDPIDIQHVKTIGATPGTTFSNNPSPVTSN